ncbi:DUF3043 domain-containing protein [Isoptericola sp. b441]|uniref:DUF3043 domain-containing protein n=1 Tax=Actinotalea lenta TaxID=3064654 RepID=A0ABT9DAP3_9CELL|nr:MULTISPECIES: DUF3043 domain-containing protein [unclassified Isoptericola]MDO8107974.1 DUF3043 domain-containing protein [Isoptericola sp. b441]MDO8120359.1 DUF3043 domain-containing protein [Isoptericola sp. b490]
MPPTSADNDHASTTGKGRPTPSRKEREAARKQPLVPKDRKLAARQAREASKRQRDREYEALKTGDERFLPARDKGPQRRWVRDYVDARHNIGEWFLPFALFGFIGMTLTTTYPVVGLVMVVVLYAGLLVAVVDAFVLARKLRAGLSAKFGEQRVQRGLRRYGLMRAYQLRRLRLPKPQVGRGQFPS